MDACRVCCDHPYIRESTLLENMLEYTAWEPSSLNIMSSLVSTCIFHLMSAKISMQL